MPHYHEYLRPKTPAGRGFHVDHATFTASRHRNGALMIGTTHQLIEKILDAHSQLGVTRFLGHIDWGALPRTHVEDSIERLATEIGPAVHQVETAAAA